MPYRLWADPYAMLQDLRRWQDETSRAAEPTRLHAGVYPAVNIYDDGEAYLIRAEVPGMDKNTLDVTAKGNSVSIRGARSGGPPPTEVAFHRRERDTGVFHRAVALPEQIDSAKTVASYKHGILEIQCPRAEAAKAHKVQVS